MSGFRMAKPDTEYLILGRGVWIRGNHGKEKDIIFPFEPFTMIRLHIFDTGGYYFK